MECGSLSDRNGWVAKNVSLFELLVHIFSSQLLSMAEALLRLIPKADCCMILQSATHKSVRPLLLAPLPTWQCTRAIPRPMRAGLGPRSGSEQSGERVLCHRDRRSSEAIALYRPTSWNSVPRSTP